MLFITQNFYKNKDTLRKIELVKLFLSLRKYWTWKKCRNWW